MTCGASLGYRSVLKLLQLVTVRISRVTFRIKCRPWINWLTWSCPVFFEIKDGAISNRQILPHWLMDEGSEQQLTYSCSADRTVELSVASEEVNTP